MAKTLIQDGILNLIQRSQPFVIVEVRGYKLETIKYTDKKTGRAAEFSYMAYGCETIGEAAEQVQVQDVVSDEELKSGNVRSKWGKGEVIVFPVGQLTEKSGAKTIRLARDIPPFPYETAA